MEYIVFDFYNEAHTTWLIRFCEYFNLNTEDVRCYLNNADSDSVKENEVIKDLNINLIKSNSANVKIMCRHMTTSTEEGLESFRKHGLLDLRKMLQLDTQLSQFLTKYKISVDVDNKIISIGNERYPILSSNENCPYCLNGQHNEVCSGYSTCLLKQRLGILSNKLYKYGATIEFFINSTVDNMKSYSTINSYPEILLTISGICSCIPNNEMTELSLGNHWSREITKCYIIEFQSILADMVTYDPIDYDNSYHVYSDLLNAHGYDYCDYINRKIPTNVFNNIFLIKWFIRAYFSNTEEFGSLLPNKCIATDDIHLLDSNNI